MKRPPQSREDALRRWPRLTAHLICESLGYFTPASAAYAVYAFAHQEPCFCEWYADAAGSLNHERVRDAGDRILRQAIRNRHGHYGPMADYPVAWALVQRALATGDEPLFASWF